MCTRKTNQFLILTLALLMTLVVLVLCLSNSKKAIGDGGLISDKPCEAPCFMGIIPDITSEYELEEAIKVTPAFNSCAKYDFSSSGGTKGFTCADANFSMVGDIVAGVGFSPSSNIKVQDVILKYGGPERIIVFEENLPDSPEQLRMRFLYDSLCMEVMTEIQDGRDYKLDREISITRVVYLGKELCQKNKFIQASSWQGYAIYSLGQK